MSNIHGIGAENSLFVSPVRVLKADELEKVVGARYDAKPFGRYKGSSGPDNGQKDPI